MDLRDDMREMAELAGQIGEDGQAPQAAAPTTEQVVERPQVLEPEGSPAPAAVEQVGIDDTKAPALDLDELLGFGKPEPAPVPEPAGGTAATESSQPAPGSVDARLSEMAERLRKAEEDRDKLLKKVLGDSPEPEQPPAGDLPELDPGTVEFLQPYIRQAAEAIVNERLGPIERATSSLTKEAEAKEIAEAIAAVVPGFRPEHLPIMEAEFEKITDPKAQAVYGDRIPGAALFARALEERGVLDFGNKKQPQPRVSPLAGRHSVVAGGAGSSANQGTADEDAAIKRLMSADPRAFLDALRANGVDV